MAIFFFDESRFGTHSKLGHGWFPRGGRTQVKVKLGFKNFYLYSAVNPKTGKDFTLFLPKTNTQCLNLFLEKLSSELGDQKIILVMDGAAWHKAGRLIVPINIEIMILPPYCPELNPVEKFWQFLKNRTIKNRIFRTLEELEQALIETLHVLTAKLISSICGANYLLF